MRILLNLESLTFVALSHKFTSLTKSNLERVIFPTETENRRIHEIAFSYVRCVSNKQTLN